MYSALDDAALPAPGFPISEIHGSMAVQRLTVAYRSRPRPSSTPGAKASTMCPYYLDGELARGSEDPRARFLPLRSPDVIGERESASPELSGEALGLMQFSRSTEAQAGVSRTRL